MINSLTLISRQVLYWPQGSLETDAEVEKAGKTATQITIDGLKPSTKYFVKVLGYSSGGDGVTSDPAAITTGNERRDRLGTVIIVITQFDKCFSHNSNLCGLRSLA